MVVVIRWIIRRRRGGPVFAALLCALALSVIFAPVVHHHSDLKTASACIVCHTFVANNTCHSPAVHVSDVQSYRLPAGANDIVIISFDPSRHLLSRAPPA